MEGVAYIERLSYELIQELSGETISKVYTAGGASNSDVWLQIRSNVLQKPIYKMKHVEGAVGAAIVAASETYFKNVREAGTQMTKIDKVIEPGNLTSQYNENYHKFIELLHEKNYY
jgi:D-ribulokinase